MSVSFDLFFIFSFLSLKSVLIGLHESNKTGVTFVLVHTFRLSSAFSYIYII